MKMKEAATKAASKLETKSSLRETKPAQKMNPTKNDLAPEVREQMVRLLNARLADSLDMLSQTKQAHWNVKGNDFIALHELFDELAGALYEHTDSIAERAVMLGGQVYGTVRASAANSCLNEYPLEISNSAEHVEALSSSLAAYAKLLRDSLKESDEADDQDTNDLLTQISRDVDKYLWFVEAHNIAK